MKFSYVFKGLHRVMLLAPIGAFGGMAFTIGKYGVAALLPLGKLMLTVYVTMAIFIFAIFEILNIIKCSQLTNICYNARLAN